MFSSHLENVLSIQNNSKTKVRCPEDVLRWVGLHITLSQIFYVRMLIWSCPCALIGFNFPITLKISSSVKFIVLKDSFVLHNIWVDELLPASIWVHCFTKNEWMNSFFYLNSTTHRLLWIKGRKRGIFGF